MRPLGYLTALAASIVVASCGSPTQPTTLSVTSITPTNGTTLGGTAITITGSNFSAGATVTIGGVAATDVTVSGSTLLTAVTAQRAAGTADVVVTSGGRTSSLPGAFRYVPPTVTTNTPPTIVSMSARGSRAKEPPRFADLDEEINATAVVEDAETVPAKLTYEWTSNAGGTFAGIGPSVTWRAPQSAATPRIATLTLTVIERYQTTDETGLPVTKENRVSKTVDVALHDSKNEIGDMARQFLLDFSDSNIRDVSYILRNFTDDVPQCDEQKRNEAAEIADNRRNFFITSSSVGSANVTFDFQGICPVHSAYGDACAFVPVDWRSTKLATGSSEHVRGTDQVSAVYLPAQDRWKLCGSDFDGQQLPNGIHPFIR